MFKLNSKLTMACSAAVLALAMAACSSSSDDNPPVASSTPPPVGDGGPDPVLTELQMAQADAAAAATAAMTASGEAATAAAAAMTAVANLATMQTDATAAGLADEAQTAADNAMAAYMDAKAASEAAAEAEVVTAAVEARIMADEAMADAVKYAMMALEKGTAAETAAMAELMIDGKDKSVGGTSVNADAASSVVTTVTGTVSETEETGRIKAMDPEHEDFGAVETGTIYILGQNNAADTPYSQVVEARDLTIGRTLDTSDDMARLMLVTHYAGTKMVRVYNSTTTEVTGSKAGYLSIDDPGTGDVNEAGTNANNVRLKSEGTYYLAGTDGALVPTGPVLETAKPKEVFSYTDPSADDAKKYVVAGTTTTGGATPVYQYFNANVEAANAAVDEDDDTALVSAQVRAALPVAIDYKHIHFGVWAALGEADKNGLQELSDLGIGFVQSIGDELTGADMPNNGTADYSGSWVAAVQAAEDNGNGDISLVYGAADLEANLTKGTITATLTDLAKLEGTIDTNTFSGTKATVGANEHNLTEDAKFTGSFSGGFYGAQAAEAGGIFDFTSKDAEAGAFRGAFGGDRDKL